MENISIFDEKFQDLIRDGVFPLSFEKDEEIASAKHEWTPPNANNLTCSYCRVEFGVPAQQREHYKLDWHRYNLKQNLLLRQPMTEEEFSARTDDVSSISGSESEEEETLETLGTAHSKLYLKNGNGRLFEMYRCLFANRKMEIDDTTSLQILKAYFQYNRWAVLMLGGGHFAGAIFERNIPILHKTFHCYTVRAGQGGSQNARDSQSGGSHPKSAGASLRRYNEMSLFQHVRDIVEVWRSELAGCSLIAYRAAGPYNKSVLFGGKTPLLLKNDPRIRSIPFSTRRATFTEVKRVHEILASIVVYDSLDTAVKETVKQKSTDNESKRSRTKTSPTINRAKSRETVLRPLPGEFDVATGAENDSRNNLDTNEEVSDDEELVDQDFVVESVEISLKESLEQFGDSLTFEDRHLHAQRRKRKPKKSNARKLREHEEKKRNELYDIVCRGDVEKLSDMLEQCYLDDNVSIVNDVITDDGNTLLHVAAMHMQDKMVEFLLGSDADPCLKNSAQQTPYTCNQNKEMREIFKNFARDNPDKYNYNKAQIPTSSVLPEELAEKKRLQKKAKREKEKVKRKENDVKKQEELEKDRFLHLSDREKRALAAERRILSQSGTVISRCFLCASDISGKVPFEYLTNRFCSIECLKAHRLQHPVVLS